MDDKIIIAPVDCDLTEKDYLRLIYEESLKQTSLIEKQNKMAGIRTLVVAVFMVVITISLLVLSVQFGGIIEDMDSALVAVTSLTNELSTILENTRITELLNNVNILVEQSGDALTEALGGVNEALNTISQIDIATLNEAIADLQTVIEPLARLFGR